MIHPIYTPKSNICRQNSRYDPQIMKNKENIKEVNNTNSFPFKTSPNNGFII